MDNLGRSYFIDHNTRATAWDDPRPPIQLANKFSYDAKPKTLSNSRTSRDRRKKGADGRERGHSLDREWYGDVLRMSLVDKVLTAEEESMLSSMRTKLNITDDDHEAILGEIGWTKEEVKEAKKDSEKIKECVVCLEAPATHVVMDCMHVCLCSECSMQYNGIYKSQGCPNCREEIKEIRKTY